MARHHEPTFDLVVATVDRTDELDALLGSLARQSYRRFRVIVVDQNPDDRLDAVLARSDVRIRRVRSSRGLSRARNAGIAEADADLVAFPDDDCVYPDDLLDRVAARLAARDDVDGLSGRAVDPGGTSTGRWPAVRTPITRDNVWFCGISYTIFLDRRLVTRLGGFDESLGLGSSAPWGSGEEIDLLVRATKAGAALEFDPDLEVLHAAKPTTPALARRDGASVGYILAKNRYPPRSIGRMLVRPAGGSVLALCHGDVDLARLRLATLKGRLDGLRGGRRASPRRITTG